MSRSRRRVPSARRSYTRLGASQRNLPVSARIRLKLRSRWSLPPGRTSTRSRKLRPSARYGRLPPERLELAANPLRGERIAERGGPDRDHRGAGPEQGGGV